jgi:hypothetical protein
MAVAELVPGLREGCLDDLAGQVVVADDPDDEVVETVEMVLIERSERSGPPGGGLRRPGPSGLMDFSRRRSQGGLPLGLIRPYARSAQKSIGMMAFAASASAKRETSLSMTSACIRSLA